MEVASHSAGSSTASGNYSKVLKHKRRFCKTPGCTRIVKSQGLCQRHGAKPRQCKVDGCSKQAQGNFDGMCKSHFKASRRVVAPIPRPEVCMESNDPPPATGESVYDRILPESIAWTPEKGGVLPLVAHLRAGFEAGKPTAWHRNEERRARGLWPIVNPATQLEGWERELVWMEILVLTGNPQSQFRHLARGWGRDKGFHMVLAQFICERRGDVERKRRVKIMNGGAEAAIHSGDEGVVVADVWDDAGYGDSAYNEALAMELFEFTSNPSLQETENHPGASNAKHRRSMSSLPYGDDPFDSEAHESAEDNQAAAAAYLENGYQASMIGSNYHQRGAYFDPTLAHGAPGGENSGREYRF